MAYLEKADLETHLYGENIDEITRGDNEIVDKAIASGLAQAKAYLNKYNLTLLFADAPEPDDQFLKNLVKDLACWHLIKLANPNINIVMFRTAYEDAITEFNKIMKGQTDPQGWPLRADDPDTDVNEGGTITWDSNTKRRQHY